jgi:hypothetical protein
MLHNLKQVIYFSKSWLLCKNSSILCLNLRHGVLKALTVISLFSISNISKALSILLGYIAGVQKMLTHCIKLSKYVALSVFVFAFSMMISTPRGLFLKIR